LWELDWAIVEMGAHAKNEVLIAAA
jgi:hypothetical protein